MKSGNSISFGEATRTWLRIGLLSFGGPAGQISLMHRILVEEKRWMDEQRFLHALSYCMLLPGPEAQQLATYVGWLLHGTRGGLVAGMLFVLPGFLTILAFSFIYVLWQQHPLLTGVFIGLKAAVIALVIQAMIRMGRRALRTAGSGCIAAAAFIAITLLHLPFPLIVLGAGLVGYALARTGHADLVVLPAQSSVREAPDHAPPAESRTQPVFSAARTLRLLALWLPLWSAPILLSASLVGMAHVYTQLGLFFSQMAVVTFGGAYAVLSYVAQQAVERYAWITPGQMVDGLGLAESTPGPLILVVQFVGFLAAYQAAGSDHPLLAGTIGALITVWVTFVPCFLWIFLGAPQVERLRGNRHLGSALAAITAAVVGVIASLALWFAAHVLFARVSPAGIPEFTSLQPIPATLTAAALLMLLKWDLPRILLVCVALGAATSLVPSH